MGWDWSNVPMNWKNGRYVIDRKAVCDGLLTQEEQEENGRWYPKQEVLKSSMVGSVYYAAVQKTQKNGNSVVWAAVFPTQVNTREYFNFGYKAMDETCGPNECQCPKGILALLTETDSEYAKDWRKRCREYQEKKKEKRAITSLPAGSKISFINTEYLQDGRKPGDEIILTKRSVVRKGKKKEYWWDGEYRWPMTTIPDKYEIVA